MHSLEGYRRRIVEGGIVRTLVSLALPLIMVQIVNISYNIVDTYWLSRYSDTAMAVPRQAWPPFMLFNALASALAVANTAFISQYIGARKFSSASRVSSMFLTFMSFLGVSVALLYLLLRPLIFKYLITTPEEIYDEVMVYAGVIAFDVLFAYIASTYTVIIQSIGETRKPAIVNGLSAIANIVLDPILIFGLGPIPSLGVVGAAIATVFSRVFSLLGLVYISRKYFPDLRISFTDNIEKLWLIKSFKIGLPVFILNSTNSLAYMFHLRLVNTFGVVAATAYTIGYVIIDLTSAGIWGLTRPVAIMVGQNIGAGKYSRAREIAIKASLLVFTITLIESILILLLRPYLVGIFTSRQDIFVEACSFLGIFSLSIPFVGVFFVGRAVGRGSGHTYPPTIIGLIRLWILRLLMGYILALSLGLGSLGIWIAMSLSNIVAGIATLAWIVFGKWVKPVIKT